MFGGPVRGPDLRGVRDGGEPRARRRRSRSARSRARCCCTVVIATVFYLIASYAQIAGFGFDAAVITGSGGRERRRCSRSASPAGGRRLRLGHDPQDPDRRRLPRRDGGRARRGGRVGAGRVRAGPRPPDPRRRSPHVSARGTPIARDRVRRGRLARSWSRSREFGGRPVRDGDRADAHFFDDVPVALHVRRVRDHGRVRPDVAGRVPRSPRPSEPARRVRSPGAVGIADRRGGGVRRRSTSSRDPIDHGVAGGASCGRSSGSIVALAVRGRAAGERGARRPALDEEATEPVGDVDGRMPDDPRPLRLDAPREEVLRHAAALVARRVAVVRPVPPGGAAARRARPGAAAARACPTAPVPALEALDDAARILDESIAQPRPRYFAFIGSLGPGDRRDRRPAGPHLRHQPGGRRARGDADRAPGGALGGGVHRVPRRRRRVHERRHDLERHGARRGAGARAAGIAAHGPRRPARRRLLQRGGPLLGHPRGRAARDRVGQPARGAARRPAPDAARRARRGDRRATWPTASRRSP